MSMAPIIHVVAQRHESDCCVSCLAMLLGVTYEEALVAVSQVEPTVLKHGMYTNQVEQAAKSLGAKLRRRKVYDLESDAGILNVRGKNFEHVVMLKAGLIINTDGSVWDYDDYLAVNKLKPGILLELA